MLRTALLATLLLTSLHLTARIGQLLDPTTLPEDVATEVIDLGLGYQHVLRLPQSEKNLVISHSLILADEVVIAETMSFRDEPGMDEAITEFLIKHLGKDEAWQLTRGQRIWWSDGQRLMAVAEKGKDFVTINVLDTVEAQRWQTLQSLPTATPTGN